MKGINQTKIPFMKKYALVLILIVSSTCCFGQTINPKEVKSTMKKVADWQILHVNDQYSRDKHHHPLDWTKAALYVGMVKWAKMADDDTYYNWLKGIGRQNEWQLHERKYHADDHAVGRMYAELYRKYGEKEILAPTIKQFDFIIHHPANTKLNWDTPYHQDRWNWCDALFMSPPVWAKLSNITGDHKYLDFMFEEYKATTDFLFDKEEHLFYRDERFKSKLDNGTKIFWGRGNGWVYAGLADIISELKPGTKEYDYFLDLFKKMSERLIELQTPKGHWAMSLLGQEFYPTPETSGSSFFVYGLAWGINNGILKGAKYTNAVETGWRAMASYVNENGMLGYVQPIGAEPGDASIDRTEVYGTGAFLSAGSEIYKMVQ
jgi:rhamnogalacturonyl hydrolase YesR